MKPHQPTRRFSSVKFGDIEVSSSEKSISELVKVMNNIVKKHRDLIAARDDYQHENMWG